MPGDSVSTAVELHCPLCDYDLRGLENPRCPECGYTFEWEELRKASDVEWKYFERAMRQKVRAYFRTLLLTLWPPKLWRRMRAIDTIVPRRLVMFWLIPYLLIPVVIVTLFVSLWIVRERNPAVSISSRTTYVNGRLVFTSTAQNNTLSEDLRAGMENLVAICRPVTIPLVMTLLWPWLTLLALQIFNQSLFVAKIRVVQLVRVIIYTDMSVVVIAMAQGHLAAMVLKGDIANFAANFFYQNNTWWWWDRMYFVPMFVAVLLPLITTGKLIYATRAYLRFRNAATMMILSQVIVTLIAWCAIVMDDDLFLMNWTRLF